MAFPQKKKGKYFTIEEYLELEEKSEVRHEYEDGEILEISANTIEHATISANLGQLILNHIDTKKINCRAFFGDAKVRIEKANSFVYPDAMVVCGEITRSKSDKNSIINPVLIIEILSDSTQGYDRGEKFHKYMSLNSFKEYVLINQQKAEVDIFFKTDEKLWQMQTVRRLKNKIILQSINCELEMKDIYKNIPELKFDPYSG